MEFTISLLDRVWDVLALKFLQSRDVLPDELLLARVVTIHVSAQDPQHIFRDLIRTCAREIVLGQISELIDIIHREHNIHSVLRHGLRRGGLLDHRGLRAQPLARLIQVLVQLYDCHAVCPFPEFPVL